MECVTGGIFHCAVSVVPEDVGPPHCGSPSFATTSVAQTHPSASVCLWFER